MQWPSSESEPQASSRAGDHPIRQGNGRGLPSELYLLFVGPEEPSWTRLTLLLDRNGCDRPRFHWCSRLAEAVRIVNQEHFDCIVIDDATAPASGPSGAEEASLPDALTALRTAGCIDPLLVLSDRIDDDWLAEMAGVDAELLITRQGWRSAALIPWIRCAIDRQTLTHEHREIGAQGRERRAQESTELQRLLAQRTALAARLRPDDPTFEPRDWSSPGDPLGYLDLLRSAVLSDAEQLQEIVLETVSRLVEQGLSAVDVLELHLESQRRLLGGLGGRSAKHVLQRTDLIGWEMLVRVAEASGRERDFRTVDDSGLELPR